MDILNYLRQANILTQNIQSMSVCDNHSHSMGVMSFKRRVSFDRNYLIPEVSELNQKGKQLASKMTDVLAQLESQIDDLPEGSDSNVNLFSKPFEDYAHLLTAEVMPLVRANMAPGDREELYQLYLDVSDDLTSLDKAT